MSICSFPFILLFCAALNAATSADFLKLDFLPAGLASAGSGTADLSPENALIYNEAQSAFFPSPHILFSHSIRALGFSSEYLGMFFPLADRIRAGLDLCYIPLDDFSEIDLYGRTTGLYKLHNMFVGVHGAWRIKNRIAVSAGSRILNCVMGEASSWGAAFSLSAFYRNPEGWTVGLSARNAGIPLEFSGSRFSLPWIVRLGLSYTIRISLFHSLSAAAENRFEEEEYGFSLGYVYSFRQILFFRTGYEFTKPGFIPMGIGIEWPLGRFKLGFSYAIVFTPFNGNDHSFMLQGGF